MDEQEFLDRLSELLSIESVAGIDVSDDAPSGKGPAKALSYILSLCESYGFKVKNYGNKVGFAEIGQGEEVAGVLCHLDVVPAGKGWEVPPFALTIKDDKAYGRGIQDDKGPALCCVSALKSLVDEGIPLKRRIRLIFGTCEETGEWDDMSTYLKNEQKPAFGITPDGDFPAIYGEKGLIQLRLAMPFDECGLISADGGDACNVVPSWAEAVYMGPDGNEITVKAEGRSAHASLPFEGKNAISALMEKLAAAEGLKSPLVDFYENCIGFDLTGEKINCALKDDKSGSLTLNVGMLKKEGDELALYIDIRYPVTFTKDDVITPITEASEPYGFKVSVLEQLAPIYMDKNSEVITTLLDVYHELTGDEKGDAIVIGGATYARSMDNIVAFGPILPWSEVTEHMSNEHVLLKDLELNRKIYREALLRLANL